MSINRLTVWEAAMKLRISRDWKASQVFGHFSLRSGDVLSVPAYNTSQSMTYDIELENNISSSKTMYIQTAYLYTSCEAERRIRIHNIMIPLSSNLQDVYSSCDSNSIVNIISKQSLNQVISTNKIEIGKKILEHRCREIATTAIKIFGNLPKSLDIFVVSILGMIKSPLFSHDQIQCILHLDNINLDIFNF